MIPKAEARAIVKKVFDEPGAFEWSVQGLGMLRCYPEAGGRNVRVHVWDPALRTKPAASDVHTHPWDFESFVAAGEILDEHFEFEPLDLGDAPWTGVEVWRQGTIACGGGGGLRASDDWALGRLVRVSLNRHGPGSVYRHRASDVHRSLPSPGCVTVVERVTPPGADPTEARVYWPEGSEWVSAEPRPATTAERDAALALALEKGATELAWIRAGLEGPNSFPPSAGAIVTEVRPGTFVTVHEKCHDRVRGAPGGESYGCAACGLVPSFLLLCTGPEGRAVGAASAAHAKGDATIAVSGIGGVLVMPETGEAFYCNNRPLALRELRVIKWEGRPS